MSTLQIRIAFWIGCVLILLAVLFGLRHCGKSDAKQDIKVEQLQDQASVTAQSVEISNQTGDRVRTEEAGTAAQSKQAQDELNQIIATKPRAPTSIPATAPGVPRGARDPAAPFAGSDSTGAVQPDVPDPDVMRIVQQAQDAASCAARRLQREKCIAGP